MAGNDPFGSESRLWPIRRSERSFFDPSWEVGPWRDFGSHRTQYETRVRPSAEAGSMTNYFDQKMREMEAQMDHMARSFSQLMPSTGMPPAIQSQMSSSQMMPSMMPSGRPSSSTALMPQMPAMHGMPFPSMPQFEQMKIDNPYVTDSQGNRKLQLQFDVHQFKPEEIQVKTENRQLCVHARHEQKGDGSQVMREYQRYFLLPENLEPDKLSSVLSPEGILSIEAAMPAIEAPKERSEVLIPIMHK